MAIQYLIRVGVMGHLGRFASRDGTPYRRNSRVILRTLRGLEIGHVMAREPEMPAAEPDGDIVRGMTTQDSLLATRLEENRNHAFEACAERLAERDIDATLVDVEHLFDGRSLYFYFLGETTPEIERLTGELAELYQAKVKFREFTEALTHGCGPDCGTKDNCSNCTSCAVGCAVSGSV